MISAMPCESSTMISSSVHRQYWPYTKIVTCCDYQRVNDAVEPPLTPPVDSHFSPACSPMSSKELKSRRRKHSREMGNSSDIISTFIIFQLELVSPPFYIDDVLLFYKSESFVYPLKIKSFQSKDWLDYVHMPFGN